MNTKHTRGPWVVQGLNIYGPINPRSKRRNGRELIGGVVDDINDWRTSPDYVRDDSAEFASEREANARLIAAAPDLLDACEAALIAIERHISPTEFAPREMLRAAITKATGSN